MKLNHQLVLGGLLLAVYGLLFLPDDPFLYLVDEDGVIENITALFFLLAAGGFFLLFVNKKYFFAPKMRKYYYSIGSRYGFLLLGLLFFFGFGEEISWGQRIFGFSTPESLTDKNAQGEFNLHNIGIFHPSNMEGKQKSAIERLFTMKQIFVYFFVTYLLIIPFVDRNIKKVHRFFQRIFLPVPKMWLGTLFLANYAIYLVIKFLLTSDYSMERSHGITEIEEMIFAIILLFLPFNWLRLSKDKISRDENNDAQRQSSQRGQRAAAPGVAERVK